MGVPLCIARARGLIEAARSSSASNAIAAANLFVLAIQEIGKAGFLVDAHATGLPAPVVTQFYKHQEKTSRGIALLGDRVAWLRPGTFDVSFDSSFDIGTRTSEATRTELLYVNFDDGAWLSPPGIDSSELDAAIDHAIDALPAVEHRLLEATR
jgi:AbiV family abortive infection protein